MFLDPVNGGYYRLIAAVALVVIIVIVAAPSGQVSLAQADEQTTVVHVVAWGDTITSIAKRYGVTVSEIVSANQLSTADHIFAGQRLVIPNTIRARPVVVDTADEQTTHVVAPGENLYRIGLQYGLTTDVLLQANGLASADELYAGQTVVIPGVAAEAGTVGVDDESGTTSVSEAGTYIVRPGDTVYSISQRFGVSTGSLSTANGLINPSAIYVGQRLVIPGTATATTVGYTADETVETHVVQAGETLSSIAARYSTSAWVLAQSNNISNPSLLYVGQVLAVPTATSTGSSAVDGQAAAMAKAIIVDISDQRAYVFENGQPKWTFVVSTGISGADTWRGEFHIQSKIPNAYASTWNLQMPYWLGFYWAGALQNGFHALPILSNGVRLWEGLLGQPASYGCVILSEADARTLYEWAEIGVPVTVRD